MFFHLPDVGSIIPKETSCSSTTDFTSLRVPFSRMPNTCKHIVQIIVKSRGKKWKATKRKLLFLPLYVSSVVGCLWWSSSSSLSFWSTLSWKVFFLLKPSFQNPDTSIPTLTEPSVDVIFQELDHPLFSLLGFPSSTSKPDTWLKQTGSWLGFTWDDILSWPRDYWGIASLITGVNTVFSSCEGPQPVLEWSNVKKEKLLWLLVGSTIYLLTWINTSE